MIRGVKLAGRRQSEQLETKSALVHAATQSHPPSRHRHFEATQVLQPRKSSHGIAQPTGALPGHEP